jgi:hypothetical protein
VCTLGFAPAEAVPGLARGAAASGSRRPPPAGARCRPVAIPHLQPSNPRSAARRSFPAHATVLALPPGTGGGAGGGLFSAAALRPGPPLPLPMSRLEIGARVLTARPAWAWPAGPGGGGAGAAAQRPAYDEVFLWGHRDANAWAAFKARRRTAPRGHGHGAGAGASGGAGLRPGRPFAGRPLVRRLDALAALETPPPGAARRRSRSLPARPPPRWRSPGATTFP